MGKGMEIVSNAGGGGFDAAVLLLVVGGMFGVTALIARMQEMETHIMEIISSNPLLQAFVASSMLAGLSYGCMLIARYVMQKLRGRFFCSITIHNRDRNFGKIIDYIGKQGVESGSLIAQTYRKSKTWRDHRIEFLMGARQPPRMDYLPANNNDTHIITYDGVNILMHRKKGETVVTGWERTPTQLETLTLSRWGADAAPLKKLIDDALKASFEEQQEELTVFCLSESGWLGGWEKALSKKPRSIESVILDEDLANELVRDARNFLRSADWYADVGIPYRRGYLLYGPPGCGKTSFCQALAGALKLDLCMLTLSSTRMNDNTLAEALRDAPSNAIVLLEDVDSVFVERSHAGENRAAGVTFSGLLNALDGVASQEGRLFFMTTNHIEKLDPALIRPGRCDVKVEVRHASRSQAERLFSRFFVDKPAERAQVFAKSLPDGELSMAQLQGYLLEHKTDADGAIRNVSKLLAFSKPKSVDAMPVAEHLRRVGLEGWAPLFEYHGYHTRADLRGLTISTVKPWSPYLRIDQRACKRMELLLSSDAGLMAEYQLVDTATAKDMFLSTFAGSATTAPLSRLADELCNAVRIDGKAAVSIWQVRHHLQVYSHSAEAAVAAAGVLTAPLPDCRAEAADVDNLSSYSWLRRACLEKHAKAFEDNGFHTARSLSGLDEAVMKEGCGIKDKVELSVLKALMKADEAEARTLLRFTSPDYGRVRREFLATYGGSGEQHASAFADALCKRTGHGPFSFMQLERCLARLSAEKIPPAEAAGAAKAELLDHVRPKEPEPVPKPKPTEWVYGWLESHGFESYADKFIEHNYISEKDLHLEPRLDLGDLVRDLGVAKGCDARKLRALIKDL